MLTLIYNRAHQHFIETNESLKTIHTIAKTNPLPHFVLYSVVFRGYLFDDFFSPTPFWFRPGYQAERLGTSGNKMADGSTDRKTVVDRYFTRIYKTGWAKILIEKDA